MSDSKRSEKNFFSWLLLWTKRKSKFYKSRTSHHFPLSQNSASYTQHRAVHKTISKLIAIWLIAYSFAIIEKRRGGSSKQLVTWVLTLFTSQDEVKVFSKFSKSCFLLLPTCTTTATHPGGLVNTGARQRRESDPHGNGEVLPWRRLASLASGHVTRWQPPALLSNVRFLRSALASWVQPLVVERTASPSEHSPPPFWGQFWRERLDLGSKIYQRVDGRSVTICRILGTGEKKSAE